MNNGSIFDAFPPHLSLNISLSQYTHYILCSYQLFKVGHKYRIYLALELWKEFNNRVFRLNWVTKDNCFRIGLLAQWSYIPQLPLSFLCMLMYFSNLGWYLQSSSRVIRMNEHTQSKISDNKSSLKYILDLHRHTNNFLKSSSNQLNFYI